MFQFQNLRKCSSQSSGTSYTIIIAIYLIHYNHSIESALLKVHNNIIVSMDKGEVIALTLLDLSAAFDNRPEYLTDLILGPKCSKYLHSTNSNKFLVCLETKTG